MGAGHPTRAFLMRAPYNRSAILHRLALPALCLCALYLCGPLARAQSSGSDFKKLTLAICEDQDEWPPYSWLERKNGQKTDKVVGYAMDVIDSIFARHGIQYKISLIPWSRCLAELRQGQQYQMALNLSWSEERANTYLLSRAYYSTTNYYYYSRKKYPNGLPINSVADLKQYPACGILGYNYTTYGFKPGEIDQSAKSFESLIAKLHLGRCALFLEKNEVMAGFGAIGKPYLDDENLGRAPVPGMVPTPFHLGISRAMPQGLALQALLDREIGLMEESGQLQALWKKVAGN